MTAAGPPHISDPIGIRRSSRGASDALAVLGLTPEGVRDLTIECVSQGGVIEQVNEADPGRERGFHYRVFLILDGIPGRLYVKMTLFDDDPDNPVVHIVSAHKDGV